MPGYDKLRFLNLTKNESEQLGCGICLAILRNPYITKCCGQAYCQDCIEVWLDKSQTCPNDRKFLQTNDLLSAPLLVKNLLNCLNISCKYKENGCDEVKIIEIIETHEVKCDYNPEAICINCLKEKGQLSSHNCIANLKTKLYSSEKNIEYMTKTYNELKDTFNQERDIMKRQLSKLDSDLINLKTLQEIPFDKINKLEKEIIQYQDQNNEYQTLLDKLNDDCKKFKAKYKNSNSLLQNLKLKFLNMQTENENLNTELSALHNEHKNLIDKYNRYVQSNQDLKKQNENFKNESRNQTTKLNKQYDEICLKLIEKNNHEKNLLEKIKNLESTPLNIEIKNLNDKLTELKRENENLISNNNDCFRDIFSLKSNLSAAKYLIEGYQNRTKHTISTTQTLLKGINKHSGFTNYLISKNKEKDKKIANLKFVTFALIMIIISLIIHNLV